MVDERLLTSIRETQILGVFKTICDNNSSIGARSKIRNIMAFSDNPKQTITIIVERKYGIILSDDEAEKFVALIDAFINKSVYRKQLDLFQKKNLLFIQNNKCAICHCDIHDNYHADHIIPFKYVGDELNNNWQILCSKCNEKKNASIDYQIKYLLNLI